MIFILRWFNVICWSSHICNKSYSLSFSSFLIKFSEWHRGSVRVKLTKYEKVEWGEKCHYASDMVFFLSLIEKKGIFNGPMFNLLFYCHIIERKWLLMRHLSIILPLKSKYFRKFQRFNTIDESIEILRNSWILKNFN